MRIRLRISPLAWKDLLEIAGGITLDNPAAAQRVKDHLVRQIGLLTKFPELGPLSQDRSLQGYRLLIVGSYIVFYVFSDDEVRIKRVLHGARLYRRLLESEPEGPPS